MNVRTYLALGSVALVSACQASPAPGAVIVDQGRVFEVRSGSRVPATLLQQAGVDISPGDEVLDRGYAVDPSKAIPTGRSIYIQVRRSAPILLNGKPEESSAATVGEALVLSGIELRVADQIEPSAMAPLSAGLIIQHTASHPLTITVDGKDLPLGASTEAVGAALAEAGAPIVGLDRSIPGESEMIPQDGRVSVARVTEVVTLVQNPIPYGNQSEDSDVLELGIEQVLQPGVPGLSVARARITLQDGIEVASRSEPDVVVRPAQDRLVVRGTKIVDKSATVDGVNISYWHTMQMYATVYSPCNSGTADGSCSTGTASGLRAGKGVVAVDPGLFAVLNGQRLYIPGYGYAVIGDIGGGYIVEQNLGISRYKWIDLGFDDDNIQDMSGWITVYFLSPAPAAVPDVLK